MFGAKARAAEYNAAKAAMARQQACEEADETEPPKCVQMSLSAFTRNASSNRNRGPKNFVPLYLSEEEEAGPFDIENESQNATSPMRDPVPSRAASLPPRPAMANLPTHLAWGPDTFAHTHVLHRYPDPVPVAPRAMRVENLYGYANTISLYRHAVHPHFLGQQVYFPQPMTPAPAQSRSSMYCGLN